MQAKDWNLPMVDVTGRKYEVTIQSTSLFNAVLSMHKRQPYADPILDGMDFTAQERAAIDHSKYVKDMREESLDLALKTMNYPEWMRTPEQRRRDFLERQITREKVTSGWTNGNFNCLACETVIPEGQVHLTAHGGHICNYHCFGNKLIRDRVKSDGH
ncbi:hypothetical protein BSK64_06495 [Paenibacillus odorifer]|uniref:hypothetical protein n=1 Tax=Paenibacillus odorifer TaxID=189426 RepID=UPI00096E526A|nr:hypothetical protein [Paenibacillus odorifer]OME07898.1 hypothetical protein BSK64_06495 [Paenibacillus odorifer]